MTNHGKTNKIYKKNKKSSKTNKKQLKRKTNKKQLKRKINKNKMSKHKNFRVGGSAIYKIQEINKQVEQYIRDIQTPTEENIKQSIITVYQYNNVISPAPACTSIVDKITNKKEETGEIKECRENKITLYNNLLKLAKDINIKLGADLNIIQSSDYNAMKTKYNNNYDNITQKFIGLIEKHSLNTYK